MKKFFLFLLLCFSLRLAAQLPNGSTAPNWTMSDITGNSHTLYNYLNNGKVVIMDFSATWCSTCWGYHNGGALKGFQNSWGPASSNYKAQVFFIEAEANNTTGCLYGSGGGGTPFQPCTGSFTNGNWVANTPYPIIDNTSQNAVYQIVGVPKILMVCPTDKKVYSVGTLNQAGLEAKALEHCGVSLVVTAPLNYTVLQQKNIDCNAASTGAIALNVTGGATPYTYLWSNNKTTATITNLAAGAYTCTITDNNGTKKITTPITLTQNTAIKADFVKNDYEKCGKKANITTTTTGGNGTYTYLWSNTATTKDLLNLQTGGNFTVTITDGLGCKITPNALTINAFVNEPTLTLSGTNEVLNCKTATVTVSAAAIPTIGNYRFLWDDFSTAQIRQITVPSQYSVNVTDTLSKCKAEQNFAINGDYNPPTFTVKTTNINCTMPIGKLEVTNQSNFQYAWATTNGKIKSGATTPILEVETGGKYFVTVTNATNGCVATGDYEVTQKTAKPIILLQSLKNMSCFGVNDGAIKVFVTGDISNALYAWNNGANTPNIDKLKAGNYTLTVLDNNGCISAFDTKISEPTQLTSTLQKATIASSPTATDASIDVNISGGTPPYAIQWIKAGKVIATTEDLQNVGAGVYILKLKDANGCQASDIDVIVQAKPTQVTDLEEVESFLLSPNPAQDFLNIDLKLSKPSIVAISVLDLNGKILQTAKQYSTQHLQEKIEVSDLPNGYYFLQVNVNNRIKLEKFVKSSN